MKTQPQKRVWVILICPADSNVMNEFDTFLCMAWLKKSSSTCFFTAPYCYCLLHIKIVFTLQLFFCFYFCFVFSVVKCNWFDFTFSWREPWVVAAWIELQFREKATDSTVQLCDWPWQVASIQSLRGWKSSPRSETPCSACYSIQVARGIPPEFGTFHQMGVQFGLQFCSISQYVPLGQEIDDQRDQCKLDVDLKNVKYVKEQLMQQLH